MTVCCFRTWGRGGGVVSAQRRLRQDLESNDGKEICDSDTDDLASPVFRFHTDHLSFCLFREPQSSYNPHLTTKERRCPDGQG